MGGKRCWLQSSFVRYGLVAVVVGVPGEKAMPEQEERDDTLEDKQEEESLRTLLSGWGLCLCL